MTTQRKPGRCKPGLRRSTAVVDAICNDCGSIHSAKETYFSVMNYARPLRCDVCGAATEHYPVRRQGSDHREETNAKQNQPNATLFAQLQASIDMLDRLGIRFDYVESDEWMYRVWRERGRGSEHIFIELADDLNLADQVASLARAWACLLPAAEHRWCTPWIEDDDDPEMEWCSFWRPRK